MELPKVTIQLVTYNSLKYLPDCLKSIFSQTYRDFQVLVIDNNSQDGTVDYLRQNFPQVTVFQNHKNLGFAAAHNQGIELLHSPYVVFSNVDILLEPDWLEQVMAKVEDPRFERFGAFGGKLFQLKVINLENHELEKTDSIDSCGLKLFRNHRVEELGAGQSGSDFPVDQEVFGLTGALVLYRRQTLMDCKLNTKTSPRGEYFDPDFFFYKEDVDLAWRARLLGWNALMVASAKAYHIRTLKAVSGRGVNRIIGARKKQSKLARYYSYRNHGFLIVKNEFKQNLIKDGLIIFGYELKKMAYILIFEWSSLKAIWERLALLPKMLEKRKIILNRAKIGPDAIRRWYLKV